MRVSAAKMSTTRDPTLLSRTASSMVMGLTGVISKCFLYGLNKVEVVGLPKFLEILDSRRDPDARQRGLITGMNCPVD